MFENSYHMNLQARKSTLPQPINIIEESYSLENDMILGWVPTFYHEKTITLLYMNELNDEVIKYYKERDLQRIIFLGKRPATVNEFHQLYQSNSQYQFKHQKNQKELNFSQQQLFCGMNPNQNQSLLFNSMFESGNLDVVIQKQSNEYDLYMRVDTNTKGHTLWYYFEVKTNQEQQEVKFNICNFRKKRCLYERGMRPFIQRQSNDQWNQEGNNISYTQYQFKNNNNLDKEYYCLSFTITLYKSESYIKIAYCVPYTVSQLTNFINGLNCKYLEKSSLCTSLGGVIVPKLIFNKGINTNKKIIVIQARLHPGESNSSWVMEGLLKYLASDEGNNLLDLLTFIIIPMMNVDGVIFGNYRTGCAGRDLNRKYKDTCKSIYPTVYAMKCLIKDLNQNYGDNMIGFFDLHGHSAKKNIFLYGPEFSLWNSNYYKTRLFAKILSLKTSVFRYFSCIFRINKCKQSTARAVFAQQYNLVNCFTIETSNWSYFKDQITYDFSANDWLQFGMILGDSFKEFIQYYKEFEDLFQELKKKQNKKKITKEEKENYLQQICQNSKYSQLLEEMRIQQPDLSFSEGQSDSERDSDDLKDDQLNNILNNIQNEKKNKKQNKNIIEQQKSNLKTQYKSIPKKLNNQNYKIFIEDQLINNNKDFIIQDKDQQRKISLNQTKILEKQKLIKPTIQLKINEDKNILSQQPQSIQGKFIPNFEQRKSPIKLKSLIENKDLLTQEFKPEISEDTDLIFQPYLNKNHQIDQFSNKINLIKISNHSQESQTIQKKNESIYHNEYTQSIKNQHHYITDQNNYTTTVVYHGLNNHVNKLPNFLYVQSVKNKKKEALTLRKTLQLQRSSQQDDQMFSIKPKLFSSPQIDDSNLDTTKDMILSTTGVKNLKHSNPSQCYSVKKHWTNTRGIQQFIKKDKI